MANIDPALLDKYLRAVQNYSPGFVENTTLSELFEGCAKSYAADLKSRNDYLQEYFSDIKQASDNNDLSVLGILIQVNCYFYIGNTSETDIYLLNYFISYFKMTGDKNRNEFYAKILFEQILDTIERGLNGCVDIIDKLFSLQKSKEWYNHFFQAVNKLLLVSPFKIETFKAAKKGLLITDGETYEYIYEYLERYVEKGLVKSVL